MTTHIMASLVIKELLSGGSFIILFSRAKQIVYKNNIPCLQEQYTIPKKPFARLVYTRFLFPIYLSYPSISLPTFCGLGHREMYIEMIYREQTTLSFCELATTVPSTGAVSQDGKESSAKKPSSSLDTIFRVMIKASSCLLRLLLR